MASWRQALQEERIRLSEAVRDKRAVRTTDERHPNWGHPDHDACGTGFVARLGGPAGYDIVQYALTALERLTIAVAWTPTAPAAMALDCSTSLAGRFLSARARKSRASSWPKLSGWALRFLADAAAADARSAIEAAAERERLRILRMAARSRGCDSLGRRALQTHAGNLAIFRRSRSRQRHAGAI